MKIDPGCQKVYIISWLRPLLLVRKIILSIVREFGSLPSQQRVCATAKVQQRHIKPSSANENKPSEYRGLMAPDTIESRIF